MPAQTYRLRVYDGAYEVLHKRRYVVTLDLEYPGLDGVLSQHLQQLTREALAANEPMDSPRLEVCDPRTGTVLLDWSGA
ncbi:hypothetical protein MCAG_03814 [Micromonospora sp. ATCC 39149]|uniref:hypothetical protein n=1 Tax=Micromonospora sp. (strain ATCC 39149 / NRRL 15099 / SCC 1413) TaxID=219305 RepID=UPI0001A504C1|nr:hypothetical protein [Micromonospora sp. ATCC 39149]EEP73487.1 hypothetical protein MCAG_03814 [Micromonospora sp. ATCC 39149]